jgi:RHS repeat-associated protein
VTTIERDERGEVVAVVDPQGSRWAVQRDLVGRPVGVTDPLGRSTTLARDGAGRLVTARLPSGRTLTYRHDGDGRLSSVADGDAVVWSAERRPAERYVTAVDAEGRRVEEWSDALGRPVRRTVEGRTTTWAWDDGAGVCVVTPPAGGPVAIGYDTAGRPAAVDHPAAGRIEVVRDGAGRLTEMRAAGVVRRWTWAGGQVVHYREERTGAGAVETAIERDGAGRVLAETTGDRRWAYRYDDAGQLAGLDAPDGPWRWTYDDCGRLVDETSPTGQRSFFYDEADQLVRIESSDGTGSAVVAFGYDERGRRVVAAGDDARVEYEWDVLGRLVGVRRSSRSGDVRRQTLEVAPDGALAGVAGEPVEWLAGVGFSMPSRIGDAEVVGIDGQPVARIDGDEVTWLSCDWRGTVGGSASPWGDAPAAGDLGGAALGYLGEVAIDGLAWLRNRVYDPVTRAFLSPDPAPGLPGPPGGLTNPYQYAANNPLTWIDPLGLHRLSVDEYRTLREKEQEGNWKTVAGWVAAASVIAVGIALIVASGGAAAPMEMGMLIGGWSAIAGTVGSGLNQFVSGQGMDPWRIAGDGAVAGIAGFATGLTGGWAVGEFELGIPAGMAVGAGAGGSFNAIGTAAEGRLLDGNVSAKNTVTSFGAGAVSGAVPVLPVKSFTALRLVEEESGGIAMNRAMQGWGAAVPSFFSSVLTGFDTAMNSPHHSSGPPAPLDGSDLERVRQFTQSSAW